MIYRGYPHFRKPPSVDTTIVTINASLLWMWLKWTIGGSDYSGLPWMFHEFETTIIIGEYDSHIVDDDSCDYGGISSIDSKYPSPYAGRTRMSWNHALYPLVIKHGNEKWTTCRWFSYCNLHSKGIFHCHVWLLEGMFECLIIQCHLNSYNWSLHQSLEHLMTNQ